MRARTSHDSKEESPGSSLGKCQRRKQNASVDHLRLGRKEITVYRPKKCQVKAVQIQKIFVSNFEAKEPHFVCPESQLMADHAVGPWSKSMTTLLYWNVRLRMLAVCRIEHSLLCVKGINHTTRLQAYLELHRQTIFRNPNESMIMQANGSIAKKGHLISLMLRNKWMSRLWWFLGGLVRWDEIRIFKRHETSRIEDFF